MSFLNIDDKANGVFEITLDRAELHNAFNDDFILELTKCFESIAKREDIRLVSICANGKSFCAGADLNWMSKMIDYSDKENFDDSMCLAKLFRALDELPMPTLAKVQGATLGGGTGIISACDYVLAAKEAIFGFTEVGLGLIPAVISPYVMNKVNTANVRAYFLSGERFDADEAQKMSLVNKVVSAKELDAAYDKQIERFLRASPAAARAAKKLIRGVNNLKVSADKDELERYTCQKIADIRITDEAQEGMKAMLEKRKPSWRE